MSPRTLLAVLSVVSLAVPSSTWAQGNTSSLGGVVIDDQHMAVPGALVTVRDDARGAERAVQAGKDGAFELASLLPGRYRVDVQIQGFAFTPRDVVIEVNQRARVELVVTPQTLAETVTVHGEMPLLQTRTSGVGQVIDQEQIERLPLNGRQFLELALLVPGVHSSHGAQTRSTTALYWRPGQNSAVSVTGGRAAANAYLLDGTTNTDPSFNSYIISLPPDAIQ